MDSCTSAGLAERRFRGTYLRCENINDDGPEATARHRALAEQLKAAGVRLESLVHGWYGAALPIRIPEQVFAELLAGAPYPLREVTDGDTDA